MVFSADELDSAPSSRQNMRRFKYSDLARDHDKGFKTVRRCNMLSDFQGWAVVPNMFVKVIVRESVRLL